MRLWFITGMRCRVEYRITANEFILTIEVRFTILKYEDFGVIRSFRHVDGSTNYSLVLLVHEKSGTGPKSPRNWCKVGQRLSQVFSLRLIVFPKALAMTMCGATLVAAWRDGGAAKRTRL